MVNLHEDTDYDDQYRKLKNHLSGKENENKIRKEIGDDELQELKDLNV